MPSKPRKKPPEIDRWQAEPPRCEVHDGVAQAVERVKWNGKPTWVCRECLDGR